MASSTTYGDTEFKTGDTIRVHQRVQEGDKDRIQVFEGVTIAIRGEGGNKSFVVRRIGSGGIGIERIFPLLSPVIEKIEVKSKGNVRRSKLYYLRHKSAREVAEVTKKRVSRVLSAGSAKRPAPQRKVKSVKRSTKGKTSKKTSAKKSK